jgi:hypothetical protein
MNRTQLAAGQINGGDPITVILQEPSEQPATIAIDWPMDVSVTSPDQFPAIASTVARIFATAATRLSQIRAERKIR